MSSFYEELQKTDLIGDEEENRSSRANIDKWIFRLLLLLLGLTPLIVMANVEEVISPLVSNVSMLTSGAKGELFTHYKSSFVLVITLLAGGMLLAKIFFMGGTIRKTYMNYVLGVLMLTIIISTVVSPNISIALNGQYNRSDGAISWLCYVSLIFIAMNIEYPKNVIRYVMYTMIPFVYINLYIITMNFYGKDLMQHAWLQKMVSLFLPSGASISADSELIGTLNQWNYMSGMFAIMTVMYLAWGIYSQKTVDTIIAVITASISIIIMFMSVSTSGFLTVVVLLPLIIVAIFRVQQKRKAILSLVAFLIITAPVFHILCEKNSSVWQESFGFIIKGNFYSEDIQALLAPENKVYASDGDFEFQLLPERAMGTGSGRIYIWDKTMNLIENRPLLGYGVDTLMYNFPHFNIDARAALRDESVITDKPHNLYLGALYGFGLIGFLMVLIIVVTVAINLVKSLLEKHETVFIGLMTALAFFIQAMFNDSLPGITPVIFVILGITFSLIYTDDGSARLN